METEPLEKRTYDADGIMSHGLTLMTEANEALKAQLAAEKQARKALERELRLWRDQGGVPVGIQGDWMSTRSGRKFWPLAPDALHIAIEDIASALAKVCRFGGHTSEFYSVAEHSCRVFFGVRSECSDLRVQRGALLHDASEAYIGAMIRPLKRYMPAFKQVEARIMEVIEKLFDCDMTHPLVKAWDDRVLGLEGRDLCPGADEWYLRYLHPDDVGKALVHPSDWRAAEKWFLSCWESVKPGSRSAAETQRLEATAEGH